MWIYPQFSAYLFTFTKEILNERLTLSVINNFKFDLMVWASWNHYTVNYVFLKDFLKIYFKKSMKIR